MRISTRSKVSILLSALALAALVGAFVGTGFLGGTSLKAHAAGGPPPILGYHVEVQMLHCINQYVPCNTPATAANSLYTQVEVDNFTPGKMRGTPNAVVLVCGYAYFDKDNLFHNVGIHVFSGFDPGTITGSAELEGNYSTQSTHAVSEIKNVVAHDTTTGGTAHVSGRMVTNNVTGLRVSGGFDLRMNGPIYDSYTDAAGNTHNTQVGRGELHCDTTASYVSAPYASGPYFVSFVGNNK